jgi:hypothetical protein
MGNKREVFLLIGRGGAILWSDAGDSAVAIPDSRTRWNAIWERRDDIEEIAHSHPVGPARFSAEDLSTMEALDSGIGQRLRYSIVSPQGMVVRTGKDGVDEPVSDEPWWAALLRRASGMDDRPPARTHDDCLNALRATLTRQLRSRGRIHMHSGADLVVRAKNDDEPAWLVVEVADDVAEERAKAQAHARAGALEFWIVDPVSRSIEVFRGAKDGVFRDISAHRPAAVLALKHFDEISVCVEDIV